LLWVSADPGCGKSVFARKLVDQDLQDDNAYTVCYFFFKDNEDQDNLPKALCSILHQLFTSQPGLIKYALPAWDKHGETIRSEREELWRTLLAAVSGLKSHKVACVFDALDECRENHRKRFISMLSEFYQTIHSNSLKEGCLKILVTSRPYDEIRDGFEKIPSSLPTIHLRGDEMNDLIYQEINVVVHARVVELAKNLKLPETTKQRLEEKLLGMEHRTYLWLYLAIEGIQTVYADSLRPEEESIESLPSSVEDAYEKILARVTSKQESQAKKILQIVVGARRPLTTEELAKALDVAMEPDRLREKIRRLCGLFIFFNNSRTYLIHQTAKEFLVGSSMARPSRWKHCFSPTETERLMARICINYLVSHNLDKGGANEIHRTHALPQSTGHWYDYSWNQDTVNEEYKTKHTLLDYSANHWISHAQDGDITDSTLITSMGKLCDIGDGSACAWFRVYTASPPGSTFMHTYNYRQPRTRLHMAVLLGLVVAAKSFLDVNDGANYVTEDIGILFVDAARNVKFGATLTALLLDRRGDSISMTQEVIVAAAQNDNGKEVMALLLDQRGDEVQITQEVVITAAKNGFNGKEIMALLLDQRGDEVQITQEVVVAAAQNFDKEVMALLLNQRGDEVQITHKVVVAAAQNPYNGKEVMTLLLNQRGGEVLITHKVVVAAAQNPYNGKEVMALLLDQRGGEVQITQEIVVSIIQNFDADVIALLLNQCGDEVQITQEVLIAAAQNYGNSKEVMALLLNQRGDQVQITQEVVVAAAQNYDGKGVMALLLNWGGGEVQITQEIVVSIIQNFDADVIALLLNQRGDEVQITQEVVVAAAQNTRNGKQVMALLLNQRGDEVQITQEVVVAAVQSYHGKEIMALLLDQRGDKVQITQEMVVAAAQSFDEEVIALLLNQRGDDVQITQEVVVAAAQNNNGKEVMALLLNQRGDEIQITQEVVVAAAKNYHGKELMALLLDQRGDEVQITHEVVVAAVQNYFNGEEVIALLLNQRGDEVKITQEVVVAAAKNYHGKEVMALLLNQRGDEVQISQEVVVAPAGNEKSASNNIHQNY
jgi:ribosomal protein S16